MIHIFIDTNIFLHFDNIEKINWLEYCNTEYCKLVIAPIVIDELDKHKIGNDKKSGRARKALHNIEELINSKKVEIREKVFIEILCNKPEKSVYEKYALNFEEQDHRLFASIIDYRDKSSDNEIYLCSDDIGPRIRATQFGVGVIKLDEKYRLSTDKNEDEKKIAKLEQENFILKSRLPILSLFFSNDNEVIKIPLEFKEIINEDLVESKFSLVKSQLPFLVKQHMDPFKNPAILVFGINNLTLSDEQIDTYNKNLVEFFENYRNYLKSLFEYNEKLELSKKVNIYVKNSGSVPADDIDIHLHFPDGFELIYSMDYPKPPTEPEPPFKPKFRFDFQEFGLMGIHQMDYPNTIPNKMHFDTGRPSIRKSNSYDVVYNHPKLKHEYKQPLNELIVIFESKDSIKSFSIDYEISAANMPKHSSGKLSVVFIK